MLAIRELTEWPECSEGPLHLPWACQWLKKAARLCHICTNLIRRRQQVQSGSGRQASTFAGEQNAAGNIGALSRKLSRGCLEPLDESQACSDVCASEDACNFRAWALVPFGFDPGFEQP